VCCALQFVVDLIDRVFILLAALSQRSLTGVLAANIVESFLSMLTRLLSPLNVDSHGHRGLHDRWSIASAYTVS